MPAREVVPLLGRAGPGGSAAGDLMSCWDTRPEGLPLKFSVRSRQSRGDRVSSLRVEGEALARGETIPTWSPSRQASASCFPGTRFLQLRVTAEDVGVTVRLASLGSAPDAPGARAASPERVSEGEGQRGQLCLPMSLRQRHQQIYGLVHTGPACPGRAGCRRLGRVPAWRIRAWGAGQSGLWASVE